MIARRSFLAVSLAVTIQSLTMAGGASAGEKITIFAAASLKTALDPIARAWEQATGNEAAVSYAGSSALARQIEAGAPADVFISADLDWMAYLQGRDLIEPGTATELLRNRIVIVTPTDSTLTFDIVPGFELAAALGDNGRLAVANTASVPAGKYAREALTRLGVWDSVAGRTAEAENVRVSLALVALGEAPVGIVYSTDAAAEPRVRVAGTFPEEIHAPIIYPAALVKGGRPGAADFLTHLRSDIARKAFLAQGFTLIEPPASN